MINPNQPIGSLTATPWGKRTRGSWSEISKWDTALTGMPRGAAFGSGSFSRHEPDTGEQKLPLLGRANPRSNCEPLSAGANALAGRELTRVVKASHLRVASGE